MKIKNIITLSMLMLGFASASAQTEPAQTAPQPQYRTVYDFQPHWYLQLQPLGMEYTRGEVDFCDMLTYNLQVAVGYNFNEYLGARLAINGWQDKNGVDMKFFNYTPGLTTPTEVKLYDTYKWKHIAPTLDVTVNLSNLFFGFKPDRLFNLGLFAGVGLNYAWDKDEAVALKNSLDSKVGTLPAGVSPSDFGYDSFAYLWKDDHKLNFMGQFGVTGDFRINDKLSAGLEIGANLLSDKYNMKRAGNADWYLTALAGIKYNLGGTYTSRREVIPNTTTAAQVVYVDSIREVIVPHDTIIYRDRPEDTKIRRDVFFTIRATKIVSEEMTKVFEIAVFLNNHPNAKVWVTGYADKGTGNATINKRLGNLRAQAVRDALVNICGIKADRIIMDSKGDTEQPYAENEKNRVSICIAE